MKIATHTVLAAAAVAAIAGLATNASAQVTIDGSLAGDGYGPALTVQDSLTNFGNNADADLALANGSEINAVYGQIANDTLYLVFTGNLESNFNKFELFIDSVAGGQNVIDTQANNPDMPGTNPDVDFGALGNLAGLTFDAGFEADYYFTATGGNDPYEAFANYAVLGDPDGGVFLGGGPGRTIDGANDVDYAIDNSNIDGVMAGVGLADLTAAEAVTTGLEFAIPLAAIGNPTGDISVSAFINGGGHDFLSNQVVGGVGGLDNLGAPAAVDFSAIAGDQFVVIPNGGTPALPGDANGDGVVNLADFGILRANFGSMMGTFATGDFNGDMLVNLADFGILRANFGSTSASDIAALDAWYATVVPEPTSLALLALGTGALLRRRR